MLTRKYIKLSIIIRKNLKLASMFMKKTYILQGRKYK